MCGRSSATAPPRLEERREAGGNGTQEDLRARSLEFRLFSSPPNTGRSRGNGRSSESRSDSWSALLAWNMSMKSREYLRGCTR